MRFVLLGQNSLLTKAYEEVLSCKQLEFVVISYHDISASYEDLLLPRDVVINSIAYTDVDGAESDQGAAHAINVAFAKRLAKATRRKKAKLVHISTDYVFHSTIPIALSEACSTSPINVYGETKLKGEDDILEENDEALVIRTSWLFGPHKNTHFAYKILHLLTSQGHAKAVHDQWSKPTYTIDLAEATLRLLGVSGIVHFANRTIATRYEWAQALLKAIESELPPAKLVPVKHTAFKTKAKRPKCSVLGTTAYETLTGLKPRLLEEIAQDYVQTVNFEAFLV